jgi:hypothetical protein
MTIVRGVAAALLAACACVAFVPSTAVRADPAPPDRVGADATRLYDKVTGATFTPRGADYIRLTREAHGGVYSSNFEPGLYSPSDAQAVLDGLKRASGYNAVRVFIDCGDGYYDHGLITDAGPDGLNQSYLDNVADFVRRAAADQTYVLPVLSDFPMNAYYMNIVAANGGISSTIGGNNQWFANKGFIAAKREYMRTFAAAMRARLGAGTSAILAYQIDNEALWEGSQAPFNMRSGTFTAVDGLAYDMSKPDRRQQAADASMVIAVNEAVAGTKAADPDTMVTIGVFTNYAVHRSGFAGFPVVCTTACDPRTDYRYPGRPASLAAWSNIDFVDIHAYPQGGSYTIAGDLATSEIDWVGKPYVIGELGAYKPAYGGDITAAAYDMRDKQVDSCSVGHGAKGWLFWTYDTDVVNPDLADQGLFFSLADDGGAINGQLATVVRPDPCRR